MLMLVGFVLTVVAVWLFGKLSRYVCALSGFVGTVIAFAGTLTSSVSVMGFGFGLILFSSVLFLLFNRESW